MYVIRWATAAAFCICAIPLAPAQQARAPTEVTRPTPPAAGHENPWWPRVLRHKAEAPSRPANEWSRQEIELAQARCTALLKKLDVVALPDAPIREESECGTPAPMRLISVGSNPEIAFSPPPLLTCDMIAALHKWLVRDVQPLARKHLRTRVVGVATMSSYSCRNAYGRAKGRLSEHGRVNALDIAGFVTADGKNAQVLADWGPIAREIAAQALVAKKQREAAEAAAKSKSTGQSAQPSLPVAVQTPMRPSIAAGLPGVLPRADGPGAVGLVQPNRLGGPGSRDSTPPPLTDKSQFLRKVHGAACSIFATVLGPEANHAHKNHFHLDLAERSHGSICE